MKNKYRIYYYCLVLVVLIVFVGLYRVIRVKDVPIDKINEVIQNNTDTSLMDQGDENKLKKLYYINRKDIDSFILYAPKTNMEANEILVLRLKNSADMKVMKDKVQERIDKQSNSFKEYRPDQYEILKDAYVKEEGLNLILVISKDSSKIQTGINALYK